jgi:hypothetical protein
VSRAISQSVVERRRILAVAINPEIKIFTLTSRTHWSLYQLLPLAK